MQLRLMVVRLVLRASSGEDYQPQGLHSGWPARSPQGADVLERSLNPVWREPSLLPGDMRQEWGFFPSNRDYRHQQNRSLLLVINP